MSSNHQQARCAVGNGIRACLVGHLFGGPENSARDKQWHILVNAEIETDL